jgi:hypothetical protein
MKGQLPGFFDPLLWSEDEAVQPSLHSNPVEFDGIKTRVVEPLPNAEEENGVLVLEPLLDEGPRPIKIANHVRE